LDISANIGDITLETFDGSTQQIFTMDQDVAGNSIAIGVTEQSYEQDMNFCWQTYDFDRTRDTLNLPHPNVDPRVYIPDGCTEAVINGGSWFLDFCEADSNVPRDDPVSPVVIAWEAPAGFSNAEIRRIIPFIWDTVTEEWIPVPLTCPDGFNLQVDGNVITFFACQPNGQYQMFLCGNSPRPRPSNEFISVASLN